MTWWSKNKVLVIGLLSAITIAAYDFIKNNGDVSWKMMIMSVLVAAAGFLARSLRGQVATICAIVATSLSTVVTEMQTGSSPNWTQVILQALILFLGAVSSPAKSRGYEQAPVIEDAKKQGEEVAPTMVGSKGTETPK